MRRPARPLAHSLRYDFVAEEKVSTSEGVHARKRRRGEERSRGYSFWVARYRQLWSWWVKWHDGLAHFFGMPQDQQSAEETELGSTAARARHVYVGNNTSEELNEVTWDANVKAASFAAARVDKLFRDYEDVKNDDSYMLCAMDHGEVEVMMFVVQKKTRRRRTRGLGEESLAKREWIDEGNGMKGFAVHMNGHHPGLDIR